MLLIFTVLSGKFWNGTVKQATTASYHIIPTHHPCPSTLYNTFLNKSMIFNYVIKSKAIPVTGREGP
jgi:hypothetical protein